jgi:hypothetical protein
VCPVWPEEEKEAETPSSLSAALAIPLQVLDDRTLCSLTRMCPLTECVLLLVCVLLLNVFSCYLVANTTTLPVLVCVRERVDARARAFITNDRPWE